IVTTDTQPATDDTLTEPIPAAGAAPLAIHAVNLTPQAQDASESRDDGLSPSVRRLVRQYDLDVTRIQGTGPQGRIRIADVVALIGTRNDAPGDAALRYATARPPQRNARGNGDGVDENTAVAELHADAAVDAAADRDARAALAGAASQAFLPDAAPLIT